MMDEPTELDRMIAAAKDSPGATIKRGGFSVRLSKSYLAPIIIERLRKDPRK